MGLKRARFRLTSRLYEGDEPRQLDEVIARPLKGSRYDGSALRETRI
jgi:hypothetical protein